MSENGKDWTNSARRCGQGQRNLRWLFVSSLVSGAGTAVDLRRADVLSMLGLLLWTASVLSVSFAVSFACGVSR